MFGVLGVSSPGPVMDASEAWSSDSAIAHTLSLTLNTDGTYTVSSTANGTIATGNWLWPPGAANSDYAVTATLISNTGLNSPTGTFGSSQDLGTARSWGLPIGKDPDPGGVLTFDLDFTWKGGSKGHTVRVALTAT